MAVPFININGKILPADKASLSIDNRAFRYGYGLFETILVVDGIIQLADFHWQRLFKGMLALYFTIPKHFTPQALEEAVLQTVEKNELSSLCRVRLQVYAGPGGLYDTVSQQPLFLIECFPLDAQILTLNENGVTTGIAERLNKSIDALSNLKSTNALIYAMAARQAKNNKWNDALILNDKGNIIESTIANIFWVKNKTIHTPPLAEGCVAGVMRAYLLQQLPALGYTVLEKPLTTDMLFSADEVFLTNAIRRIKWVKPINKKNEDLNLTSAIYKQLFMH
jgi:branched-chain amino acid aminotransferase